MAKEDNQQVKSRRDALSERLKAKYPDSDFSDDEALFGQISDDYDDYDSQLQGYQEREKKISDMFTSDPRSAYFMTTWSEGGHPAVELVRQFGLEIKDAIDDPKLLDKITAANDEYLDRVAESNKLHEEYKKNFGKSMEDLEKFLQERGLSEEDGTRIMQYLWGVLDEGVRGIFTEEQYDKALKAMNYDTDIDEAEAAAEVRGKNARIDEKLRRRQAGDGTANLNGGGGTVGQERRMPQLGALDNFASGDDIWQRGGERRSRYNG